MPTTEYDIQQLMAGWFRDEGLVTDSDPNVSAEENAGNPHYLPTASAIAPFAPTSSCCSISGASSIGPGAVFADITWMGYTGRQVPERYAQGVRGRGGGARRRDRARPARGGRRARSCAAGRSTARRRRCCGAPGYGDRILHRTGHSLGEAVHGNGVNMDDYETHDDRRLLVGTGFTIEPGVYFDDFGVRSEINMIVGPRDASVTGPVQTEIVALV